MVDQQSTAQPKEQADPSPAFVTKVPGAVPPIGRLKHEVATAQSDIRKKTVNELQDILTRQKAVLANKKLCSTLPDKGAKLRAKVETIEASTFTGS